jgi:tripartite-type tricarboxylate transporter receptor subunit TctC
LAAVLLLVSAMIEGSMPASAQNQPVSLVTMASPGATQDQFAQKLKELLAREGIDLTVINAPGEGGLTAARQVLEQPADGRHLLLTSGGVLASDSLDADAFEALVAVGRYQAVMITSAQTPESDIRGIIARVKAEGRPMRWAHPTATSCLQMKVIGAANGFEVECVLSNGPALLDLVASGEADAGVGTGTHRARLEAGDLKVVGRMSTSAEGDSPTAADLGAPEAEVPDWMLISAPAGLEPNVKAELTERLLGAVNDPSITPFLTGTLLMAEGVLAGEELAAAIADQRAALGELARFQ